MHLLLGLPLECFAHNRPRISRGPNCPSCKRSSRPSCGCYLRVHSDSLQPAVADSDCRRSLEMIVNHWDRKTPTKNCVHVIKQHVHAHVHTSTPQWTRPQEPMNFMKGPPIVTIDIHISYSHEFTNALKKNTFPPPKKTYGHLQLWIVPNSLHRAVWDKNLPPPAAASARWRRRRPRRPVPTHRGPQAGCHGSNRPNSDGETSVPGQVARVWIKVASRRAPSNKSGL